jgi:hypothetical protein
MSLIADAEVLWGVLDQSHLPDGKSVPPPSATRLQCASVDLSGRAPGMTDMPDRRCRRMDRMSLDCIVQIYRSDPSPSPTLQRGEAVTVSKCVTPSYHVY